MSAPIEGSGPRGSWSHGEGASGAEVPAGGWRAVLFDLDGTLADTVPLILHCYRHTMRTHLGQELPDEAWLRTIGTPLRVQLQDFARDAGEAARMLETYVAFQREVHDGMVRAIDGAAAVLDTLRGQGVRLGVVTSKKREMALRTLGCCGLLDYVEVLVGADDVTAWKPDPEPVRAALRGVALNADPAQVLFVGDSPFDVRAGRGAGVRTAAVLEGPFTREVLVEAGPDHVIERLGEVLALQP